MLGDLVTLPLRLSARAGSIALRVTERVAGTAFTTADAVLRRFVGGSPTSTPSDGASDTSAAAAPRSESPREAPASSPVSGNGSQPEPTETSDPRREADPDPAPPPPAPPTAEETLAERAAATPTDTSTAADTPAHVSEEPELVEEVADPGAEDGAGAQVTVEEPWEGYAQLTAQDVIDRLAAVTPEELAAVKLYESTHRARQTVLDAVDKKLTAANHSRD